MIEAEAGRDNGLARAFNQIGQARVSSLDLRDLRDLIVTKAMTIRAADWPTQRLLDRHSAVLALDVPLKVDVGVGGDWAAAHG